MINYFIWDIDPRIINGFDFLRWYGLCWAVGILIAYQITLKIFKTEGISVTELDKLATYVILGMIIGARFGHILFYDPIYYLNNPIEILPIQIQPSFRFVGLTGLASHGGILGALIALYLYTRKYNKNYLWVLDRLVIGGALMGSLIRVGNLLNSEIVGIQTTIPWAFIFTRIDLIPRHPTPFYEAILYLIVSVSLFFIWKSRKFQNNNGFVFGLGMVFIFVQRFLVEYLKENQVPFEEKLTLNMGQILSIPLILVGLFLVIWSLKSEYQKDKVNTT